MTDAFLQRVWYGKSVFAALLWPLSLIFIVLSTIRRWSYRVGVLRVDTVAKPVIVVGNVTVGGTGKTPFVLWLAESLRARGLVPGIVTRGYGGAADSWPQSVTVATDPIEVGDEAALLAKRFGGIVVAGPDRVQSAQHAIDLGATVIVSDDGLQHYRLARDFEIAMVDAGRLFGNGLRLPAGPLRESRERIKECDAAVRHVRDSQVPSSQPLGHPREFVMRSRLGAATSVVTQQHRALESFSGTPVHAFAAIGNPQSFFASLRNAGLQTSERSLRDHASISVNDLSFGDDAPVLMTEKDAVKCRSFADSRCWSVSLEVDVEGGELLLEAIVGKLDTSKSAAHSVRLSAAEPVNR
jgi:tetraacyldisaccharide 4'-kinase